MTVSGAVPSAFTPPFEIRRPAAQTAGLVFSSPHSGRIYPPEFLALSKLQPAALRKSEDCLVDELFADMPRLGAPLISALFPRAYLDLNREPYELDPELVEAPLPDYANTHSVRVAGGLGTIARIVADGEEIYRQRLPLKSVLARIESLYFPFHAELTRLVNETMAAFGYSVLIDCHSMPSSAVVVSGDMAGKDFGQTITPVASANSLTYLHEWTLKKDTDYLRLDINRYARRTLPLPTGAPLTPKEQAEYQRGMKLYDAKNYPEAAAAIQALTAVKRSDPGMLYNLACCLALAGRSDEAVRALTDAFDAGWRNFGQTGSDPDFASVSARADFKALLQKMREAKVSIQPTRAFSARTTWSEAGEPAPTGPRYMLSTMLGVASGRGNSVSEVLDCLRRAAAADGSNPHGTFYFEKNGDVRSTTREWAFPFAQEELQKLGLAALTEDGILPTSRPDVAGAVIGTAGFSWPDCKSTIAPGAIVEHLTSCGGMMGERDTQTPCTDFIRAGAAGTSGAVTEPYALQEKFPDAFMHLHYARGSTLAEAFYQSLRGPYQLLIIGDPLCRPWTPKGGSGGKASLPAATSPLKGTVTLKPAADPAAWGGIARFDLFVDGTLATTATPGNPLALDTTRFPDGDHTLTVVAVHKDPLESRSRGESAARFANAGRSLKVGKKPAPTAFGQKATVQLECPGATGFDLRHLGRTVAHADGDKATLELDTARLGLGHALLLPVALGKSPADTVTGAPLDLEITPPATLPSAGPNPPASAPKGLALTIAGGPPKTITDTLDPAWLAPGSGVYVWADVSQATDVDAAVLRDVFHVHELAVADAMEAMHHPKVEVFGGVLYVVLHGINFHAEEHAFDTHDTDFLVTPQWIVTVHDGKRRSIAQVGELCDRSSQVLGEGPVALMHRIMDTMVGHYLPEVDELEKWLDDLERQVLERPDQGLTSEILAVKRDISSLRRIVIPQRDVLARLSRREFDLINLEMSYRFRDVYDHLVRLSDDAMIFQDRVTGILDAHLADQGCEGLRRERLDRPGKIGQLNEAVQERSRSGQPVRAAFDQRHRDASLVFAERKRALRPDRW